MAASVRTATLEGVELHSIADTLEIAPGVRMPRLGLGTWRAHGRELTEALDTAFALGYRLLDTSANYGNEQEIGEAIAASGLPREQFFVTTKLEGTDQGRLSPPRALNASLRRLGLDYVDLYLIHWPEPSKTNDTWAALEDLQATGAIRAIGVSNFDEVDLEQLFATAKVPPAVDQFEFHPLRQSHDLQDYCGRHGITVEAWAPVMRGRAGRVPELERVARQYDKTAEQVCLRWILQKGYTAIPKTVHAERLRENADIFDFEIEPTDMALIDALDSERHMGW